MDKLWKPKNRREKWAATAVLWFGISAIYSLTGESQVVSVIGSVLAISGTVYVWFSQSSDYDNTGDIVAKERKIAKALEKEEARKVRGTQLAFAKLRYYGGGVIDREKDLLVTVTTTGLTYGEEFIPMNKITNVSLETQSQVQSRLTVTRMVAFGIFSLAAPKRKKTTEKYLAIEYNDGFQSVLVLGGYGTTKIQSELIKAKRAELK